MAFYRDGKSMNDDDFYLMINMYWEPLEFTIQQRGSTRWKCILNTSLSSPADINDFAVANFHDGATV